MSPKPSLLRPVTHWLIVSDPLCNVVQIFLNCTFSSPLPLAFLLPYYIIQGPDFYSEFVEVHNV